MKSTKSKNTTITLAAATVLGLSLLSTNTNAQGWWGGHGNSGGYNNAPSPSYGAPSFGRFNRGGFGGQRDILRSDVNTVDQLARQMTRQFARDLRYNPRCRESIKLMNHLRTYSGKTSNLVRAYNGTCKVTFKRAAREVRDTLTCVQNQAKRVRNLSCSIKGMIDQSCPIATRILRNADRFNPAGSFTGRSGRNNSPVVAGRGDNVRQDPYALIFSNLLRKINW